MSLTQDKYTRGHQDINEYYRPLEPLKLWIQDRWTFCRRMLGDTFCHKVFFIVCTFIWMANGIENKLWAHQDALIEGVFGYRGKRDFLATLKKPTDVWTFNGKYFGKISDEHLQNLWKQVGIIGPIAAMLGRDIEQEFIKGTCWYSVKESLFQQSIDNSKTAIGIQHFMKHDEYHQESRRERS